LDDISINLLEKENNNTIKYELCETNTSSIEIKTISLKLNNNEIKYKIYGIRPYKCKLNLGKYDKGLYQF